MPWPLPQDYNEAVQSPRTSFSDAELRSGGPVLNDLGIPIPCSGNFADVYEVRSPSGGRWAVKCFTREVPGLRERYAAISRQLRESRLPFSVDFTFLEEGVRVHGRWYPVLKMQWVEGHTLNEFVRQYADKPAMLENLLLIWARMAARLRGAGVAHADLQHGNVLLVPGSTANSLAVKLVDYDGMFVPALAGGDSGEVGHPNFQHPQRAAERTYSAEVDRFPLLLVATALGGLKSGGRALWDKYDSGDNLLFREADLRAPVKSPVFYELLKLPDERAARLARLTVDALKGRLESAPLLEEVLPELLAAPAPRPAAAPAKVAPTAVAVAVAGPVAEAEASPAWDFEGEDTPRSRRRRKGGMPRWVWGVAAAGVAVLALVGGVAAWALWPEGGQSNDARFARKTPPGHPGKTTKAGTGKDSLKNTGPGPGQNDGSGPQGSPNGGGPGGARQPTDGNGPKAEGFEPLFNGKDTKGWRTHDKLPGEWHVEDGVLTCRGESSYLFSERGDFENFHIKARVRINRGGNSGLFFRCEFGLSPWFGTVIPTGYETEILGGATGSLLEYGQRQTDHKRVSRNLLKGPNDWFDLDVIADGDHIVILVNGQTAADCTLPAGYRKRGHFVLQHYTRQTVVEFSKIEIKELPPTKPVPLPDASATVAGNDPAPPPTRSGSEPVVKTPVAKDSVLALFNGKDLTGWKIDPKPGGPIQEVVPVVKDGKVVAYEGKLKDGKQVPLWRVEDGALIGSGPVCYLFSERDDFQNFSLRTEAMINDGGDGGVYFRAEVGAGHPKGYEAKINSTARRPRTGSLSGIFTAPDQLHKPDVWFTQEVITKGDHITINVNDKKVNDKEVVDKPYASYRKGRFALRRYDTATVVKFRKIEVELLDPGPPPSTPAEGGLPSKAVAAKKEFEKADADARKTLLAGFDKALTDLPNKKMSPNDRRVLIGAVKDERQRFEQRGLVPWSPPMQRYRDRYVAAMIGAQGRLRRAYDSLLNERRKAKDQRTVDLLQADLKDLEAEKVTVVARWHFSSVGRPGSVIVLYSNGRTGEISGPNSWRAEGGVLELRWPNQAAPGGAWVDRCTITNLEGTTFSGTNQQRKIQLRGSLVK